MIDVMAFEGEPILEFDGEHRWLSNFYDYVIVLGGKMFASAEHAYQATKSLDPEEWKSVQLARSPGQAKRLGRKLTLRPDWENVKVEMMRQVVAAKFPDGDSALTPRLLATGNRVLVEGNTWGDRTWGATWEPLWSSSYAQYPKWAQKTHEDKTTDVLVGDNWLGRLLMERRAELRGGDA